MKHAVYFSMLLISFGLLACTFAATAQVEIQWDNTLGGDSDDFLQDVISTPDGGYFLAGSSRSDISGDKSENRRGYFRAFDYWIIKLDENGKKQWDKTLGGNGDDILSSVITTADGGYLLAGHSDSNGTGDVSEEGRGEVDYWIVKVDENGNKQWDKVFGGNLSDARPSVIATTDGGYLIVGDSDSPASEDKSEANKGSDRTSDYWIIKIDGAGNKQWDKTLGGSGDDRPSSIILTADGGYLLTGTSSSPASGDKSEGLKGGCDLEFCDSDYWIIKIDGAGNKQWDKDLGSNHFDHLSSAIATADGGYLLAGYSASPASADKSEDNKGRNDYWIVKVDEHGNKQWDSTIGGSNDDYLSSVITTDEGYLLSGYSTSNASADKSEDNQSDPVLIEFDVIEGYDYWIVKIDKNGYKLWDKGLGGSGDDISTDVSITADGAYLVAGSSNSGASGDKTEQSIGEFGYNDYWIVKVTEAAAFMIKNFTLINIDTDEAISSLEEGAVVNLSALGNPHLSVRANTTPINVDSVKLELTGPAFQHTQVEHYWPYALFGDDPDGPRDYLGLRWKPGAYTLTATPYLKGQVGTPFTVSFTVVPDLSVASFTLVNADTEEEIQELRDADVLDLAALGDPALTVRANSRPVPVDSVLFELSGPSSETINWNEYHLVGDAFSTDGAYAVTPEAGDTKGAAWNKHLLDLNYSFDFSFTLNLCGNADGMVFALQQAGLAAIGGQQDHHEGSELGYYYEPHDIFDASIGVELDIYNNNGYEPFLYYDPPEIGSHVTLVKHGNPAPITELVEITPSINNCEDRLFRVVWHSAEKKLEVYLDNKLVISHTEDIVSTVFHGEPQVYFGFTGATGAQAALQTFRNKDLIYEGPVTRVHTEHYYPYALFGDAPKAGGGREYLGEHLQPGQYSLTATPYLQGSAGTAKTVSFSVTGNTEAAAKLAVYPVPTSGVVNISYQGKEEQTQMMLLDDRGNVLLSRHLQATEQLDLSSFKKGTYYLKLISQDAVQVKRIVVE